MVHYSSGVARGAPNVPQNVSRNSLRIVWLLCAVSMAQGITQAHSDLFEYTLSRSFGGEAPPVAADFSADGNMLAFASESGEVRFIRLDTRIERTLGPAPSPISALAVGRRASLVMVAGKNGPSMLFTDGTPAEQLRPRLHVTAIAVAPGEDLLAAAGDGWIVIWSARSKSELLRLAVPEHRRLQFLAFAGGDARLIGVAKSGEILEWDITSRALLRQMRDSGAQVLSADLNPAATMLAVGTEPFSLPEGSPMRQAHPADFHRANRISIYDLDKGALLKQIEGVEGELKTMSMSSDGRFLAAVRQRTRDAFVSVYDLQRGVEIASIPCLATAVIARFSPDGQWLAGVSLDGNLALYSIAGVQRSAQPGDLAGVKIQVTSAERKPLLVPETPIVVAVLDFENLQGDPSIGRALAEMLRNRLAGAHNVHLVEREEMRRIIGEQNFQNTDRADSATAVQLGRILSAQKTFFGTIGRLGATYTIDVRMIDVETATIDGVREVICQRCTVDDLPQAMAELAAALVGPAR